MIEDLTLTDTETEKPQAAFLVSPQATQAELLAMEAAHRRAARDHRGSGEIVFTRLNEDTGEEEFENAERWQQLMSWPRLPTVAEALSWQAHMNARQAAALWEALNSGSVA